MSTDPSTIDAYNKNAYLYSGKMRSGKNYAHLFIEKPAMSSLLDQIGDLSDKKILALGCGSGEEVELLRSKGAKDENIIGIDISEELIKIAQSTYSEIEFHVMDISDLRFDNEQFDLIYSSLVMHYVQDWSKPLDEIYRVLKKSGQFVFSAHHPLVWGAGNIQNNSILDRVIGYRKYEDSRDRIDLHGTYLSQTSGDAKWFNSAMKIKFFNRSISEMFKSLKNAGFKIQFMDEPNVLDEAKEKDFKLWKIHSELPMFIVWRVKK